MPRIPYKPMSVNRAWQGKRYKTAEYRHFSNAVANHLYQMNLNRPPDNKPLFAHYEWGLSNYVQSDTDNPTKPFQDILCAVLKMKDNMIDFMILQKKRVKRGEEYIGFHIDTRDGLIGYLKALIKQLEAEE